MASRLHSAAAAVAPVVTAGLLGVLPVAPSSAATAAARTPTSWLVTNPNADGSFEVRAGSATMHNLDTGTVITCSSIDASGTADSGTVGSNYPVADIFPIYYPGCASADGTAFEGSSPPWGLMAESYDAGADRVAGWVYDDYDLVFMYAPGVDCFFELIAPVFGEPDAQADFSYDNASSTLEVTHAGLEVNRATGADCEGIAHNGDKVAFSATFRLTPNVTVRPTSQPYSSQVGFSQP